MWVRFRIIYILQMILHRGRAYRLYPSGVQREALARTVGVARLVYNLALEQRRDHWRAYRRAEERSISYPSQAKELTALRAAFPWIAEVSQTAQQQALRDLDKAFQNFFLGRAAYPRPRKKFEDDSARFQGRECAVRKLSAKWAEVTLPKVGKVRFRLTRPIEGIVKNVTVSLKAGRWMISFACEREIADPPAHVGAEVGIDLGVTQTLTLSTGEALSLPLERLNVRDRQRRRLQKKAARCKRGSNRSKVAKRKVAKVAAAIAAVRRQWQHQTTKALAERFSVVVMEDLRIRNMTASAKGTLEQPGSNVRQKAGLNRSILNQGWGELARQLEYKLVAKGGQVIYVDPRHSSQTCSVCEHESPDNRKSQAVFRCLGCGEEANADANAARVILSRRNTPALDAEGSCDGHPCEASTEATVA